MTLVFLEAILDRWLEIFTQAFASNSLAQKVGPIGLSLPFISTHVITSSGWIMLRYSISGGTSTVSLLGAFLGADFKPPYWQIHLPSQKAYLEDDVKYVKYPTWISS
jgi:hypothetical protein